jgi:hypothetical protein
VVLNPALEIDRQQVMQAMKAADIGYRIITGGCFLRHDVIKYFDYDTVGDIINANIAHDRGFFVGNHPRDLAPQIERLHEVLDGAAVARRRSVMSLYHHCSCAGLSAEEGVLRCNVYSSPVVPVTSDRRWSRCSSSAGIT